MTTLEKAHDELAQLAHAASHRRSPEALLWAALASVADHLRRIVDHGHSAHYRADKAGGLVEAALRVQRESLICYAGPDLPCEWLAEIDDLHRVTDKVVTELAGAMWSAARGHHLYNWQTPGLVAAVADLRQRTARLCELAVPDPDGAL